MKNETINKYIYIVSIITMLLGIFGMLYCVPHLYSRNMADLVGAGFPFVAGAILFGTGLLTLGITAKK